MDNTLIALYCAVDDFCKDFCPTWEKYLINSKLKKRNRLSRLKPSEIITIFVYFHILRFRDFKTYYTKYTTMQLKNYFPGLVSYQQMVSLLKSVLVPMSLFLHTLKRKQHKVFANLAAKAKSSMGWFFGFKLHLIINDKGEIMAFKITAGNVDDRKPVPDLVKLLTGKLVGDKGYISQKLLETLANQGIQLITKTKKNMKNKIMEACDKILLRKRAIIETVNDQLKNISQLEHTRHRSIWSFMVNILGALIAYSLQPKKPSLNIKRNKQNLIGLQVA